MSDRPPEGKDPGKLWREGKLHTSDQPQEGDNIAKHREVEEPTDHAGETDQSGEGEETATQRFIANEMNRFKSRIG